MVSHLFFYQLVLVALVWLCVMLQWAWPSAPAPVCLTTPEPPGPRPKRHHAPTPLAGLTKKPHCDACEHASAPYSEAPRTPPPRIVPTRGRRRQVDTSTHFCPNPDCLYRGWVGWGNLRANGHPNGGSWRQRLCVACHRYFLETLGTLCKGEDGLRQQLALYHVYDNFCLPHASLRQPVPQPVPTHGTGSATQWRPCTPAMAAGLTDHVWTLREVLLFRVPPWPQPAGL
jgi:hypothetical protein